jgi:hypothetical protein
MRGASIALNPSPPGRGAPWNESGGASTTYHAVLAVGVGRAGSENSLCELVVVREIAMKLIWIR